MLGKYWFDSLGASFLPVMKVAFLYIIMLKLDINSLGLRVSVRETNRDTHTHTHRKRERERLLFLCSVQLLSRVQLFATPRTAACQASLSITNSWSLLKLMSSESVMPSSHLILCHPLLPPIPPSIRVFSNESTLCMRWPTYWSFSFSISPSNEHPGLIRCDKNWLEPTTN